ncbi:alpha-glucosidase [Burkholderia ubonensis]|uniref:alpha-glucosidase n=1 Tax=Burkholderia ubonensis TaxID=101571 RepID=UPI000752C8C0|nr:alpha-glucosidase [Burkholderia ubonensis]KVH69807.1 alpha-glucosidase [Burkholderia ubonensis]KVU06864.1 alpha-glucosidase [Burkholderia ubonensis]
MSHHWWRGGVIYQVYPRSFADSNGDGLGDLPGLVGKLSYIHSLGVDAIWISPFFRSPMKDFGYDVSDYCDVDPIFGTLDDFDRLVEKAHALGLKVMIDQVLSHSSDQHPWFVASRDSRDNAHADWYVWADPRPDGTPPNNWQSVFGGSAWQWEPRRRQYYLHNFLASQPDLNFHCAAAQDRILDNVRFWLERGVDGFRFDACNFHFHDRQLRDNPPAAAQGTFIAPPENPYGMQQHRYDKTQPENLAFLKRLRSLLDEYGAASVGEVGDDDALTTMAQYTADGDKLHMAYSFNLLTPEFTAAHVRDTVESMEARLSRHGGLGWACWSAGNHDVPRVMTRWGNGNASPQLARMVLAMLTTLRGSVCVYQGEELALTEADIPFERLQDPYGITFWPEYKGRDGCRTPMPWHAGAPFGGFSPVEPWLPLPPEHLAISVDRQDSDTASVLAFFREFLAWRKRHPTLRNGDIRFIDAPEPILAFERTLGDACYLLAFNLGATRQSWTLPDGTRVETVAGHGLSGAKLTSSCLELMPHAGWIGARVP